MGMNYDDNSVERKRYKLKERLLADKEKNVYKINEFGEIVRNAPVHLSNATNNSVPNARTLRRPTISESQSRYDKVWSMVKNTLYAHIGGFLAIVIVIVLVPSWNSHFHYHVIIILNVLQGIGVHGKWNILKENKINWFFDGIAKVNLGVWIVLFLTYWYWLGCSTSIYEFIGMLCCMVCILYSYYSSYRISKYIRENNML